MSIIEASEAKKEPKHIILDQAIDQLSDVLDQANKLHSRIVSGATNEVPPDTGANVATQPSLTDVLENSPARIRDYCDELHKTLEAIRVVLF